MEIQWFPGHMTKTRRMMEEDIKLVDLVVEVVDARIPFSSKNPYLDTLWQRRPRIIALNTSDLADPDATKAWKAWYERQGFGVVELDALHNRGLQQIPELCRSLLKDKRERDARRGMQNRPMRLMITGIPNVGKSTVINQVAGRAGAAKTGNKPGVTRGKQWIRIKKDLELLDTPGILWPKFEDPQIGTRIAFIGSIKDEILDLYTLAVELVAFLQRERPQMLSQRYGLEDSELRATPEAVLEFIGNRRGHRMAGGAIDVERTARMVLDEFRMGKLGRITLEYPPEEALQR